MGKIKKIKKVKGRRSIHLCSVVRRYCMYHNLVGKDWTGKKFNDLAELVLDHLRIPIAKDVPLKNIVNQLYEQGVIKSLSPRNKGKEDKPQTIRRDEYYAELTTNEWGVLRERILERDGHRCQMCDDHRYLQVHHKRYLNDGRKAWEYPENLLITVCRTCHAKHHGKKK